MLRGFQGTLLVIGVLLLSAQPAQSQEMLSVDASTSFQNGVIMTLDPGQGRLFATSAAEANAAAFAGFGAPRDLFFPGGPFPNDRLGDQRPSRLSIEPGFNYIRPNWSNTRFRNLFPAGIPGLPNTLFPQDIDHDFGFAPRIDADYFINDSNFNISTSGMFVQLSAKLQRTVDAQTLDSTSNIDITSLIFPEVNQTFRFGNLLTALDVDHCEDGCLADTVMSWSLGLRYGKLHQSFQASITGAGGAQVQANSEQTFAGLGLTGSFNVGVPLYERLVWYSRNRFSMLLGEQDLHAKYSATGIPTPVGNTVIENRSIVVPVGDFEMGLIWHGFSERVSVTEAHVWVKVGMFAQVWGRAGMLSAAHADDAAGDFRNGNLTLMGFTVQLGFER